MKHQTLRLAASFMGIIAWLMAVIGVVVSVVVGIGAATVVARIGFVLGGFIVTAFFVIMLLAASRLINLFIEIEEDLSQLVKATRDKAGD